MAYKSSLNPKRGLFGCDFCRTQESLDVRLVLGLVFATCVDCGSHIPKSPLSKSDLRNATRLKSLISSLLLNMFELKKMNMDYFGRLVKIGYV